MTSISKHKVRGQVLWIRADFGEQSSPIYVAFEDPAESPRAWQRTTLQVADARHRPAVAARLANDWGENQ